MRKNVLVDKPAADTATSIQAQDQTSTLATPMEMGLSLVPHTGARLCPDGLTLVEHGQHEADAALDVLMVTAASPRTKAEQAALKSLPGDALALEKRIFTFSTPAVLVGLLGISAAAGALLGYAAVEYGYKPPVPEEEEVLIREHEGRVRDLGHAPSVYHLLEAREQVLAGQTSQSKTRAELAALQLSPIDALALQKQVFTFSTPFIAIFAFGVGAAVGAGAAEVAKQAGNAIPTEIPSEERVKQQAAEQVSHLGQAPSVSQLLVARELVLSENTRKKR